METSEIKFEIMDGGITNNQTNKQTRNQFQCQENELPCAKKKKKKKFSGTPLAARPTYYHV